MHLELPLVLKLPFVKVKYRRLEGLNIKTGQRDSWSPRDRRLKLKFEIVTAHQEDHPLCAYDFINFKAYCLCIMKGQLGGQRSRLSSTALGWDQKRGKSRAWISIRSEGGVCLFCSWLWDAPSQIMQRTCIIVISIRYNNNDEKCDGRLTSRSRARWEVIIRCTFI
jgi:hypothetical protein